MMSLKTIPGFGKSGTSRILRAGRSERLSHADATLRSARQKRSCERLLGELGERLQILERPLRGARGCASAAPARRAARAGASRSAACGTCAGGAASSPKRASSRRRRRRRRRSRGSASPTGAAASSRPNSSSSRASSRRDPRALAELLEVELRLLLAERRPAGAAGARSRAGDASSWRITRSGRNSSRCRRRIVSQPLDVVLAEEPVAAARPPRRQQALVLEVADLRDRDVRELVAAGARQTAPIVSSGSRRGCAVTRSSAQEGQPVLADLHLVAVLEPRGSIRVRFTKVPLRLPWSSIEKRPSSLDEHGVARETVTSSRKMSQSGERPIDGALARRHEVLARAAAARADDERRPLDADRPARRRASLAAPRAESVMRRVARLLALDEQRAAARAVVGGLRVLEPALRAVDVASIDVRFVRAARAFAGEDLRQPARRRPRRAGSPPRRRAAEARDELRAQDVDLAVQDPPLVRDSFSSALEVVDQVLELLVGERGEIGQRVPLEPFRLRCWTPALKQAAARRVNLSLRISATHSRRSPASREPPRSSARSSPSSSAELLGRRPRRRCGRAARRGRAAPAPSRARRRP